MNICNHCKQTFDYKLIPMRDKSTGKEFFWCDSCFDSLEKAKKVIDKFIDSLPD